MSVRSRQLAADSQRFLSMVSAHEQQLAVMANDLGLDRRDAISKQSSHRDVDLRLSAEEKARLLGRGTRANQQNRPSPWADFQAPAVADSAELEDLNDGQTWRINRAAQASALGGHMGNGAAVPAFARNQGRPFAQFAQPTPLTTPARGGRRARGSSHLSRAERNTIQPPPVSNHVPAAPPRGSRNQRGRPGRAAQPSPGRPLADRITIPTAPHTTRKIANPINTRPVTPNGPSNRKIAPLWAPLLQAGRSQAPHQSLSNKVLSPPRHPGYAAEFPFRVTQARIAREQAASPNPYPKTHNENVRPVQPSASEGSPKTTTVPTPAPTPVRQSLLGSHNYRPNIMDMDEPVTSLPPPLMPIMTSIMTPITTPILTPKSMTSPHIGDSAMPLQDQFQIESQPDHQAQANSKAQGSVSSLAQVPTPDSAPDPTATATSTTSPYAITQALEELAIKIRGLREDIAYASAILEEEEELGVDERRDVEEGLEKLQTIKKMYVKRQAVLRESEQSLAEEGEIVE